MKRLIFVAGLLCPPLLFANEEMFLVETTVSVAGDEIAQPKLAVESGTTTYVSVEDQYEYALLLNKSSDGGMLLNIDLEVGDETLSPRFYVTAGSPAIVRVGSTEIQFVVREFQ
ncbi:MAG: hypothetical protein AAGH19_07735 [Pseudomonadota bacterium]